MRAIAIAEPKRLERIEIEEPGPPAPGHVLVRTHRMGICGSDVSGFLGKFPFFQYPRIPGHELGVEVLEIGRDVTNVKPKDRCSVEPYLNCGYCYPCRRGRGNCCENLQVIGIMCDGGLCDRFLIPAEKLHRSAVLSYEQLALVETLAIGCHGASRIEPQPEDHVLVIGAGPIGLSMLEFVESAGSKVTVMDQTESRLAFCENNYLINRTVLFEGNGSEVEPLREVTCGDRFDIVVDATGSPASMGNALNYVAHSGKLLFLGVTSSDISFPHSVMHQAEMTIMSSRNALGEDFDRIIPLIEQGELGADLWITHRLGFDEVIEQFDRITRPKAGALKAIIEVN